MPSQKDFQLREGKLDHYSHFALSGMHFDRIE